MTAQGGSSPPLPHLSASSKGESNLGGPCNGDIHFGARRKVDSQGSTPSKGDSNLGLPSKGESATQTSPTPLKEVLKKKRHLGRGKVIERRNTIGETVPTHLQNGVLIFFCGIFNTITIVFCYLAWHAVSVVVWLWLYLSPFLHITGTYVKICF